MLLFIKMLDTSLNISLIYKTCIQLRSHVVPFHTGVITNGGAKPNIIPECTELEYYVRAPDKKEAKQLRAKLVACAEGAVKATGCEVMFINRIISQMSLKSNSTFENY